MAEPQFKSKQDALDYILRMCKQTYPIPETAQDGYTGICNSEYPRLMDNLTMVDYTLKTENYLNPHPIQHSLDKMIEIHLDAIDMLVHAKHALKAMGSLP